MLGHVEIVDFIIKNHSKMELNDRDAWGLTPFYYACMYGPKEMVQAFFNEASLQPMLEESEIENVTLRIGCPSRKIDFNAKAKSTRGRYYTPLHYACQEGNVQAVAYMLEHFDEIDWNATCNVFEDTPLHVACEKGHIEVIKLMAESSKTSGINLTAKDKYGNTPLDEAWHNGHFKRVMPILYANIPKWKIIWMNLDIVIGLIMMPLGLITLICQFFEINEK